MKPPVSHNPAASPGDEPGDVFADLAKHTRQIDDKMFDARPPLSLGTSGDEVEALHAGLEKLGHHVPAAERKDRVLGAGTIDVLRRLQRAHGLAVTGELDRATRKVIGRVLPAAELPSPRVEGRVLFDNGLPGKRLSVRVYEREFGGKERLLGEATTDEDGYYSLTYEGRAALSLSVRAAGREGEEVQLSKAKVGAERHGIVHLVAPAALAPAASEHRRLLEDVARHIGSAARLAEAKEDAEQRDLSILHEATGWDARLLALASAALREERNTGIPAEALYTASRLGLPSDPAMLSLVPSRAFEEALHAGRAAGITDLPESAVSELTRAFEGFARKARRAARAPGAPSSFGELAAQAKLAPEEARVLEELYFEHRGTPAELLSEARKRGIAEPTIDALRRQGKLAHLTLNNAALMASLERDTESGAKLERLLDGDFHTSAAWEARLNELSGGEPEKLAALVPPAYPGEGLADRVSAYAEDLARKVRTSLPTQVIARRLQKGEIAVADGQRAHAFLTRASDLGFSLGRTGVQAFVTKNREALFDPGTPDDEIARTVASVKTVQRLYQITPTDAVMGTLARAGLTSAHEIAAMPFEAFVRRASADGPATADLALCYRKAQQVSAVTLQIATSMKLVASAPAAYALSDPTKKSESEQALIEHFPDLAGLFGSLDFCECEHCRSVLGPAAYLVDVLRFLDPSAPRWDGFLSDWKAKHGGNDYMAGWKRPDGTARPGTEKRPYDALVERRPDLPHLPLTCENTNTALPYIDVVNEVLEYWIAKGTLDAAAAKDTGAATTPELLAEPQHVEKPVYDAGGPLQSARYPLALPFHLPIETVRRFLAHFESSLSELLDAFRQTDDLSGGAKPYGRAAVFLESLGLSPAEAAIFGDVNPLANWFKLYGYSDAGAALAALPSAKTLADRLGLSYRQLIDVVRSWFVNPRLDDLAPLYRLGLEPFDVLRYESQPGVPPLSAEERAAFEKLLQDHKTAAFDPKAWLDKAWSDGLFSEALVLADTNPGCDFAGTRLVRADGQSAADVVYVRANLFVRLWRKLGWTMEEVDQALRALLPGGAAALTAPALGPALATGLLHISHLKELDRQLPAGKNGRVELLSLWGNMPARGPRSPYAERFLSAAALRADPAFDDPLGNYLSTPGVLLEAHVPALQAGLQLGTDDIARILAADGKSIGVDPDGKLAQAELSLAGVSLLHRHALLARALSISVSDLLALVRLSGLDPFTALPVAPIATIAQDVPFSRTLAFVRAVRALRESGFTAEELRYLLAHDLDPGSEYSLMDAPPLALLRDLAAAIRRIEADHPLTEDAVTATTDEALRQELALVLPPDLTDTLMGMWTGTAVYEAAQGNVEAADALDPEDPAIKAAPAITVSYDALLKEQKLTRRGVLTDAEKAAIVAPMPAGPAKTLLSGLLDAAQAPAKALFAERLQAPVGFLGAADFDALFGPAPAGLDAAAAQAFSRQRRAKLLGSFLPFLVQALVRDAIVTTLATEVSADPTIVALLLGSAKGPLADPSAPGKPLFDAFSAAAEEGMTAAYHGSADATGAPIATGTQSEVDTGEKPAGTNSARFEGYLGVPASGPHRFFISLDKAGAEAELYLGDGPDPVLRGSAAADAAEIDGLVDLSAGVLHRLRLVVKKLGGGDAALRVQGRNLPKGPVSALTLVPEAAALRLRRGRVLVDKVFRLIGRLGLEEREIRFLEARAAGVALSLPTRREDASDAAATALFGALLRLATYAKLKREIAGGTAALIEVFEAAQRSYPAGADPTAAEKQVFQDACRKLGDVIRREPAEVAAAATAIGALPAHTAAGTELRVTAQGLTDERGLERLFRVLALTQKLGVSASAAAKWAVPDPTMAVAEDLRNVMKARYEAEVWSRVARPIFDDLRKRRRDALVAHVVHTHPEGFKSPDQLFEYFLIDPGMEPVVLTSRLRLAISSVQTFVQRCFLNLEPHVHPSALNGRHWEWMKRYRVWEANRKLFLYPENWLEPELRDDKTHLFQELEGALLQGDVSDDLVQDALHRYLTGLDAIARLDIVTSYLETSNGDDTASVLHVIGRTYGLPHRYFYRRYAHDMWTPWEPVDLEIEGDHVAVIVWRTKLHLFWVSFLPKPDEGANATGTIEGVADKTVAQAAKRQVEIQLSFSDYLAGKWTPRTTSGLKDPVRANVAADFDSDKVFIHVTKDEDAEGDGPVTVHLVGEGIDKAFRVPGRNSVPEIIPATPPVTPPYTPYSRRNSRYLTPGLPSMANLQVFYVKREVKRGKLLLDADGTADVVLGKGGVASLVFPGNAKVLAQSTEEAPNGGWKVPVGPFFYQNRKNTFFVRPEISETTSFDYDGWIIPIEVSDLVFDKDWWRRIPIEVYDPRRPQPGDPPWLDPLSRFELGTKGDWTTNPGLAVEIGGALIGRAGYVDPKETAVSAVLGGAGVTQKALAGAAGLQDAVMLGGPAVG